MKHPYLTAFIIGALGACPLAGNWQMLDNFETGDLSRGWTIQWREGAGTGGGLEVIDDPIAAAGNRVGSFTPGEANSSTAYNVRAWIDIPPLEPGNTAATLYLRFALPEVSFGGQFFIAQVDTVWGLTPVEVPAGYGDYTTLMRVEFDNSYDVYDGRINPDTSLVEGYKIIRDTLTANVWYEVWMVMNHQAREYKVYTRGGPEFPEQVQIFPFANDQWTLYRNPAIEAVTKFLLSSSAGTSTAVKGIDPFYIDDVYIDLTSHNLTSPLDDQEPGPGPFAPWTVVDGWVNTGAWLGQVYVGHYPWVFLHKLGRYVYAADNEATLWFYMLNNGN
jgi:hypothetical protein